MILVGNQRGGGKNLALHLMKDENECVEVHQIRGFASDDLQSAFQESYAISRATRCKQHLFSLSLNPPHEAQTSPKLFEMAADQAEDRLGLAGQPRALVLHTKNGRTHAHAVWCRIDTETMKAVQLSFTKRKMQDLSRDLYREHGWVMPRGFERSEFRDPRNYSLAEWQQAKRAEKDPVKLKAMFQDTWQMSDSKAAFETALRERGFHLAQGGRRGHVTVDFKGEVYPLSRWVGIKAKDVRARLGEAVDLPSVAQAQRAAKDVIAARLEELQREERARAAVKLAQLERKKQEQERAQKAHRDKIRQEQTQRRAKERSEQRARIRKGLIGLLDRVTGKRRATLARNATETLEAERRDQAERKVVAQAQARSREQAIRTDKQVRAEFSRVQNALSKDAEDLRKEAKTDRGRADYIRAKKRATARPSRKRSRDGPDLSR